MVSLQCYQKLTVRRRTAPRCGLRYRVNGERNIIHVRPTVPAFNRQKAQSNFGLQTRPVLWTNNKVRHKQSYEAANFNTLRMKIKFDTNVSRSFPSPRFVTIKFDTTREFY